eukprot:scaffold18324_cov176-Amphora_coffeaeformis.AAC.11
MSMAVWEGKEPQKQRCFFYSELKVSPQCTYSKEGTELFVGLVDISVNEPKLLCKPVGIASLRIKTFGEVNQTTQLVSLEELEADFRSILAFRVDNRYYKPPMDPSIGSIKPSHSERKKSPIRFFSSEMLGISWKKNAEEMRSPTSEQVNLSLESGLLLLDVSWKHKGRDLETIVDVLKLPTLANSPQDKMIVSLQEACSPKPSLSKHVTQ